MPDLPTPDLHSGSMPPRSFTILRDAREKLPLIFPPYLAVWDHSSDPTSPRTIRVQLNTRDATIKTADYVLAEAPTCYCIERKRSLQELAGNLATTTGRRRFLAELSRISTNFTHGGLILLEGTPQKLNNLSPSHAGPPAHVVRDLLLEAFRTHPRVGFLLTPMDTAAARAAAGEWVAAALIEAYLSGTPATTTPEGPAPCQAPTPSTPPSSVPPPPPSARPPSPTPAPPSLS